MGVVPDLIDPANIDETPQKNELPAGYARRMACAKATAIATAHRGAIIIGADTVVACGRHILPKAEDEATARSCLIKLSGRRHRVYSAVTIIDGAGVSRHRLSTSIVTFKQLNEAEIGAYLARGEWQGKAGGYAIQGLAEAYIRALSGSHSGVMGLPLFEVRALLIASGYPFA
jgi:septum formation protein